MAGSGLAHLHFTGPTQLPAKGGVLGALIGNSLGWQGFGFLGATLFSLAPFSVAITPATGLSWFKLMDLIGRSLINAVASLRERFRHADIECGAAGARRARGGAQRPSTYHSPSANRSRSSRPWRRSARASAPRRETQIPLFVGSSSEGEVPPLALLDEPAKQVSGYSQEALDALSRQVEFKLKDFRIEAQVVSAHPGPVITRFEMQPAPGIKGALRRPPARDKDIARGLSVISVRVVDVIPGKSVIGLEIPQRQPRDRLSLRDPALRPVRPDQVTAGTGPGQGHRRCTGGG